MLAIAPLLNELNPQQRQAVLHQAGPAIVLAGAGSGKTRVLTTRVAYLLKERGVLPQEILLVTFTNKAAAEMKQRVVDFTEAQLPFAGTFHSLAAKILRHEALAGHLHAYQRDSNFTIYDSDDQLSLIKNIYKQLNLDPQQYKPQVVKAKISSAKNELIGPSQFQELARDGLQVFATKVYKHYQLRLQQENAMDFDDLLVLSYRLLSENPQLQAKYQSQFSHILVDEFQDTNRVQYLFTRLLSKPQNNLFAVGDFSQSIYAWRGADYRNLQRLTEDFPGLTEYRLERNYRSTQTILEAATSVISHNRSHPVLELWTDQTSEDKIEVFESQSGELEAEKIASLIRDKYRLRLGDIAILYRTNAQSRAFEEAFLRRSLPYRIIGGTKFYERSEVKDLLAYLRLCFNPLDSPSHHRAEKAGKRRLAALQAWLAKTDPASLTRPSSCLHGILEHTKYVEKYDPKDPEDALRLENIQELLNVASRFDHTLAFLENVALIQDGYLANSTTDPKQRDTITLMSLHSAKGLEFPIVFMVGMEEGLLPHSRALLENNELEEERRLCYVGITRAKQQLYLSYARNRFTYGYSSQAMPSRFLSEIKTELLSTTRHFQDAAATDFGTGANNSGRRLVVDEDSLDALLNDELDIRDFLRR